MAELIHVKRDSTDIPFGFKIQGGSDFSVPLSILSIVPNSVADRCGLRPGDAILKINDADVSWMDHGRAKTEIIRAGNEFYLTVERNAVDLNKPVVAKTPLSQLKSNAPVDPRTLAPPPPAPKTDLTIEKRETINIGTSHNRAPMPFNKEVGNTIDYKAAKPSNWQPGDYTKWTGGNELPAGNKPLTAVFHNPYNSPIGMYSDANVLQEFQNQTKGLIPPPGMSSPAHQQAYHQQQQQHQQQHQQQPPAAQYHQQQPAYNQVSPSPYSSSPSNAAPLSSAIQSINYLQQIKPTANQVPRGCNSLSMNMLNLGIHDASATNSQPPSVFDLKRGSNPTGASVPRGFRSVQAPTELPPEQRRAPTRTEYQVQHVKQNWVEPKIN